MSDRKLRAWDNQNKKMIDIKDKIKQAYEENENSRQAMTKYLITDAANDLLAIVDGLAGVQQIIEEEMHKFGAVCLEDFRVYEIGKKMALRLSLETMEDD